MAYNGPCDGRWYVRVDIDRETFACSSVRVELVADLALAAIAADRVDADVLAAVVLRLTLVVLCPTTASASSRA